MTLRKPAKSTIAGSSPSSRSRWTIFMTGWLKFWAAAIPQCWASTPIPPRLSAAKGQAATGKAARLHARRIFALLALLCALASPTAAQRKARRARRPAAKTPAASPAPKAGIPARGDAASLIGPVGETDEQQLARLSRVLRERPSEA